MTTAGDLPQDDGRTVNTEFGEFTLFATAPEREDQPWTVWVGADVFGDDDPEFELEDALLEAVQNHTNARGEIDEGAAAAVDRLCANLQAFVQKYQRVNMLEKYGDPSREYTHG